MTISPSGGLAAICIAAAIGLAAPSASAANAGVNIIYPPKRVADFDRTEPPPAVATTITRVKVRDRRKHRRFFVERRRYFVDKALFQLYHVDRKLYGGRLYPF